MLHKILHSLSPETAHDMAISALSYGLVPAPTPPIFNQPIELFGLRFPNPVGLAAGFDKSARAYKGLLAQGFGFVEVGTVTPQPQAGNPKPRLFRLSDDAAIINRFGFNNDGAKAIAARLKRPYPGIVGVNIGKQKDTPLEQAGDDYATLLDQFTDLADYITINISSPNTQGLRSLQEKSALLHLLKPLAERKHRPPLLLKIAPDMDDAGFAAIAEVVDSCGMDGVIVSNTTISRPDSLSSVHKAETGGLSGAPLQALSRHALERMVHYSAGAFPIISAGGIDSPKEAWLRLQMGASLVQIYSALIYQGFGLVRECVEYIDKQQDLHTQV